VRVVGWGGGAALALVMQHMSVVIGLGRIGCFPEGGQTDGDDSLL
jgi:hypothetical protein